MHSLVRTALPPALDAVVSSASSPADPTPALESPLTHAQPPQHKLYWQQTLSVIINWK